VKKELIVVDEKSNGRGRTIKFVLIASIFGLGLFSCNDAKTSKNGIVIKDSSSYEASIYRQNCAICHGKEAFGKQVDGKPVPSLRFGEAAKKTKEEIYEQIANGKLPMPSFKDQLTEKEIRRMVKFVMEDLQGRSSDSKRSKTASAKNMSNK